jgi:hypothetical protein
MRLQHDLGGTIVGSLSAFARITGPRALSDPGDLMLELKAEITASSVADGLRHPLVHGLDSAIAGYSTACKALENEIELINASVGTHGLSVEQAEAWITELETIQIDIGCVAGPTGPTGPTGTTGPGPTGPTGATGPTG